MSGAGGPLRSSGSCRRHCPLVSFWTRTGDRSSPKPGPSARFGYQPHCEPVRQRVSASRAGLRGKRERGVSRGRLPAGACFPRMSAAGGHLHMSCGLPFFFSADRRASESEWTGAAGERVSLRCSPAHRPSPGNNKHGLQSAAAHGAPAPVTDPARDGMLWVPPTAYHSLERAQKPVWRR